MNGIFDRVFEFFSGEGGMLKLAIVGTLFSAALYEMMKLGYNLRIGADGAVSISQGVDGSQETELTVPCSQMIFEDETCTAENGQNCQVGEEF